MTPAERASAVAFALKNCALGNLSPDEATLQAARLYEHEGGDPARLLMAAGRHAPSAIFARTVALNEHGWRGSGDLKELQAIHLALFDGVHEDAGKLRTKNVKDHETDSGAVTRRVNGGLNGGLNGAVDAEDAVIASGPLDDDPQAFFPANLITTEAMNISTELAEQRNLRSLDRAVFTHALAKIYDELGYLHPFNGGNAMVLRIFASRLAHDAGWDLDWGEVTRERYRKARRQACRGDITGFESLFADIQRPANPTRVFLIAGWDQGPAH
ncbi:Fic/DOC family protein [Bifidobacterium mongoliense]|uniref:Fic/DOC family protein n=1 Tax=Bifidobacterium mongoliense TaxID=518643 RepID=UPI0030EBB983